MTSQLFGLFFDKFRSHLVGSRCRKSNTCVVIRVFIYFGGDICAVSAIGRFVAVILRNNFLVV